MDKFVSGPGHIFNPVPKNKEEALAHGNVLAASGNYPVGTSECFNVGISGGCGPDCFVYLNGECEEPQEMVNRLNQKELKRHFELYSDKERRKKMGCNSEECTFPKREKNYDARIHRSDCNGFDDRINCIGCFKAYVLEVINSCHDHMLMDPTSRGTTSRAYKKVTELLSWYEGCLK